MTVEELIDQLENSISALDDENYSLSIEMEDILWDESINIADIDDEIDWVQMKIDQNEELIKERKTALKVINQIRGINDES